MSQMLEKRVENLEKKVAELTGDVVLQEIWRIKDTLSASYGHNVKRLFAETRKREKLSGHPLVEPPKRRKV
jgi:hypothetical protein